MHKHGWAQKCHECRFIQSSGCHPGVMRHSHQKYGVTNITDGYIDIDVILVLRGILLVINHMLVWGRVL